jgi:hypothetical protein
MRQIWNAFANKLLVVAAVCPLDVVTPVMFLEIIAAKFRHRITHPAKSVRMIFADSRMPVRYSPCLSVRLACLGPVAAVVARTWAPVVTSFAVVRIVQLVAGLVHLLLVRKMTKSPHLLSMLSGKNQSCIRLYTTTCSSSDILLAVLWLV